MLKSAQHTSLKCIKPVIQLGYLYVILIPANKNINELSISTGLFVCKTQSLIPHSSSCPCCLITWKTGIGHTNSDHYLKPDYCRSCSLIPLSGFKMTKFVGLESEKNKHPYASSSCHEEMYYEIHLIHAFILPLPLTMINNSIMLHFCFWVLVCFHEFTIVGIF